MPEERCRHSVGFILHSMLEADQTTLEFVLQAGQTTGGKNLFGPCPQEAQLLKAKARVICRAGGVADAMLVMDGKLLASAQHVLGVRDEVFPEGCGASVIFLAHRQDCKLAARRWAKRRGKPACQRLLAGRLSSDPLAPAM